MAKILIVEDDEVIARGMAEHLRAAGFDPIAVGGGEAGLARLQQRADDAGVALVLDCPATVELPIRQRMLEIVATNLVENAIRYAGPGATFTLSVREDDGSVVLTGADDGPGVSAEDLPRLFERFYRTDRARASRGTGLGLAIVKHVIASAGGSAEARNQPEGGLEVRCTLPVGV